MRNGELLAYIAGVLDNRASIFIRQYKYKGLPNYVLRLVIYHKDKEILDFIREIFRAGRIKQDEQGYDLEFGGKASYTILKKLVPYLITKKSEAELGIKFYESRKRERPLSDEERERRKRYYLRMKELKRK